MADIEEKLRALLARLEAVDKHVATVAEAANFENSAALCQDMLTWRTYLHLACALFSELLYEPCRSNPLLKEAFSGACVSFLYQIMDKTTCGGTTKPRIHSFPKAKADSLDLFGDEAKAVTLFRMAEGSHASFALPTDKASIKKKCAREYYALDNATNRPVYRFRESLTNAEFWACLHALQNVTDKYLALAKLTLPSSGQAGGRVLPLGMEFHTQGQDENSSAQQLYENLVTYEVFTSPDPPVGETELDKTHQPLVRTARATDLKNQMLAVIDFRRSDRKPDPGTPSVETWDLALQSALALLWCNLEDMKHKYLVNGTSTSLTTAMQGLSAVSQKLRFLRNSFAAHSGSKMDPTSMNFGNPFVEFELKDVDGKVTVTKATDTTPCLLTDSEVESITTFLNDRSLSTAWIENLTP